MTKFLLQINSDGEFLDTFVYDVYHAIKQHNWFVNKSIDSYDFEKVRRIEDVNLKKFIPPKWSMEYIPVGSVEFVESFLKLNGFKIPKPLNIPKYLRKVRYARNIIEDITYKEYKLNEDKYKRFYIKSAEKYKHFDLTNGDMLKYSNIDFEESTQLYISSEINPEIIQEFRAFVLNDKILSINNYISEHLFYKIDEFHVDLLNEIIKFVKENQPELRAYTIDYVVSNDGSFNLLELHHGYACGNYGFTGSDYLRFVINGVKQLYENRTI